MQSYLSDMLARDRISEFHRAADRDRLASVARAARRVRRAVGAPGLAALRPRRAAA